MNTTRLILDALRRRHEQPMNGGSRAWVFVEEARVATGFDQQSIDAFALHTWPSKNFRRVAYEVKVSRPDLLRELAQPWKCEAALALSNQFYLVIPSGLLVGVVLPDEWGIIEWNGARLFVERAAPYRETPTPPYSFMLSIARNLQMEGSP